MYTGLLIELTIFRETDEIIVEKWKKKIAKYFALANLIRNYSLEAVHFIWLLLDYLITRKKDRAALNYSDEFIWIYSRFVEMSRLYGI